MRIIFTMALIAGLSLLSGTPEPADPPIAGSETVIAVAFVTADFDEESNLVGVTLETGEGVIYRVELDQKGREVGETLNGEWVEAEGEVMEREGELWMMVKQVSRYTEEDEDYYYDEPGSDSAEGWEGNERWDDPDQMTDDDEGEDEAWEDDEAVDDEEEELEDDGGNGEWVDDGGNGQDDDWSDEADDRAEYEDTDLP